MIWLAYASIALIAVTLGYTVMIFVLSRTDRPVAPEANDDLFFVFMIPCLNEEKVLGASLQRLLAVPTRQSAVLVIDDDSNDATAMIAQTASAEGLVWLYRRTAPRARRGKGAALNGGLDYLLDLGLSEVLDPERTIVCVLDADGRIDPDALTAVSPYFVDPKVGAVQIGVRMYNREVSLLARLQDVEFVTYTDIFQRGRQQIGSVGLGGNGQFMRLSALASLGADPWSDCLTEDLDLGIRMITKGWGNRFCAGVAVHQQAVTSVGRLVRQRSRWFQGHLQASRLMPEVVRGVRGPAALDLIYHLASPVVVLIASLLPLVFVATLLNTIVVSATSGYNQIHPTTVLAWYLVSCAPAIAYGLVYRRSEPDLSWWRCLALGHLYLVYGYLWFAAGWWAVARVARRKQGWLKTART